MPRIRHLSLLLYCIFTFCDHVVAKPRSFHEEIRSLKQLEGGRRRVTRDTNNPPMGEEDVVDESSEDDSDQPQNSDAAYDQFYVGPVCDLVSITNHVEHFRLLENCTVVEGVVHIAFLNDGDYWKYNLSQYTFPKLRVITEHLIIYRVYELKSLRHMFPNLVMIGGEKLFSRYALTIFENPDLVEIGLDSLMYIKRGGVRIENNGNLCYLGTINWALLGKGLEKPNKVVAKPKLINNNMDGCIDQCNKTCRFPNEDGIYEPRCWGPGHDRCQSRPCGLEGKKCDCHPECLGGCTAPNNASACFVCKHVFRNGTCVKSCDEKDYLLDDSKYHCVTKAFCKGIGSISHEGKCVSRCPSFHKQLSRNGTDVCERCDKHCYKECKPESGQHIIDNERSLHAYKRCTVFKGKLIISLSVADMTSLLEETFNELEEVGSLVVRRSEFLTSLSFFQSLKRITGERKFLENAEDSREGYSVYILDNKRLKDLWNVGDNVNFTIGGGKAFFHFNPYLCLNKIEKIKNLTTAVEDLNDVSETTNGDRMTCNMKLITNVKVVSYGDLPGGDNSVAVKITWDTPEIQDHRSLIGYNIYYRKKEENGAPITEDDLYEESSWSIAYLNKDDLTEGNQLQNPLTSTLLNTLLPYTEYICYIATYTTAFAPNGAKSEITPFQTKPSRPSHPRTVTLAAVNSSAISVTWEEPRYMNGRADHYIIKFSSQHYDAIFFYDMDVCANQGNLRLKEQFTSEEEEDIPQTNTGKDCSCSNRDRTDLEKDAMNSAQFEDFLINELIIPNPDPQGDEANEDSEDSADDQQTARKKRSLLFRKRYRRSLNTTTTPTVTDPSFNTTTYLNDTDGDVPAYDDNDTRSIFDIHRSEEQNVTVNVSSEVFLLNLTHFTEYEVSVQACNHAYETVDCSKPQKATRRTKKLEGADDIMSPVVVEPVKHSQNDYIVKFEAPQDPNSLIILYTIHLTSQASQTTTKFCCSKAMYLKNDGCILSGIKQGKHTGRVEPQSLAGVGKLSAEFTVVIAETESSNRTVLQVVSALSAFTIVIAVVTFYFVKKRMNSKQPPIYASVNPEYSSICVYEPDEYEIDEDDIKLIREIGQGHFGKVYEGVAKRVVYGQLETRVAVKTGHGGESVSKRMEFLKEASVMKAFNSHHVVRLLGVVSKSLKPMMVMEYMFYGDMKTYLRSVRPEIENRRGEPPTLQQKLQMCGEIADGMAYLADSKYVHRDLAARNCLVHEDMTVKISDFGLTRDVYETDYYRIDRRGILPVRWMAPESLKDGVFDSRSDVWSFGVVLWEIATLAEQPYQGRQHDEVTRFVIDGGYMEQPKDCPQKLYDLMLMCWHYSPGMRPNFIEIVAHLLPDLSERFKQLSFYGEQKEVIDRDADDVTYINGSEQSTEGLLHLNGTANDSGDGTVVDEWSFRHMNGGRHPQNAGDQEESSSVKDEDQESVRYVLHPIQPHLHTTTC